MQIYLGEAVSPLEVDASREEGSNYHVQEVVAYIAVGCDHSQNLHQLGYDLEVDPRPGVVAACDPSGELAFASVLKAEYTEKFIHAMQLRNIAKDQTGTEENLVFKIWDDATINQELSEM